MINLTQAAAEKFAEGLKFENEDNIFIRIAAKTTKEGGISHTFGIDDRQPDDIHLVSRGIDLIIYPKHKEILAGLIIDFGEIAPGQPSFIFMNPNDGNFIPPVDPDVVK